MKTKKVEPPYSSAFISALTKRVVDMDILDDIERDITIRGRR